MGVVRGGKGLAGLWRFHQPAHAGPFADGWRGRASWDKFENLSGQKFRRRTSWETCATDTPTWRLTPGWNVALAPSPQLPPAVTRFLLTGRRFAGGGAPARRGRRLAADLIHQPTRGRWGLAAGGRERRPEKVERRCVWDGANLEYGAFRRFSMRSAAARGGECGLPHGTTSPCGVVQPRRAAWDAVSLANRPRVERLHQPADAGRSPGMRLRRRG